MSNEARKLLTELLIDAKVSVEMWQVKTKEERPENKKRIKDLLVKEIAENMYHRTELKETDEKLGKSEITRYSADFWVLTSDTLVELGIYIDMLQAESKEE